ncbi:VUT family protein [bacterium]|nr:VUT family protein [bacterium]NBW58136.1 VUT family protein [bacterium]NBX72346.1 VUT family protein [bacterium]
MFIGSIASYLETFSAESVSFFTLICCYIAIVIALRQWREAGLYIYSAIAVIACNIQVLTAAFFSALKEPIALGTVIYTSIFLVNDILTERFGSHVAKKCVLLSFFSTVLLLVFMTMTLAYKPLPYNQEYAKFIDGRHAVEVLFSPNLSILLASQIAYLTSQWCDIMIFARLRAISTQFLWLRSFFSVALGALIDTLIFNGLAWQLFSHEPVSMKSLINHYILGSYVLQLLISLCNIPIFYFILHLERLEPKK